jgi:hypothetical protein
VDASIRKFLRNIPYVAIDFHTFKDDYGLPSEVVNPHRTRSKEIHEVELKEVFGPIWGRSGYSFVNCHNAQVVDKIKEIYPIIYGKINLPKSKLIKKEFVKGIFVEMVKQKKVSWA